MRVRSMQTAVSSQSPIEKVTSRRLIVLLCEPGDEQGTTRRFYVLFSLLLLSFLSAASAWAQQGKKTARIGYLSALSASSESTRADAIRLALHELGYAV